MSQIICKLPSFPIVALLEHPRIASNRPKVSAVPQASAVALPSPPAKGFPYALQFVGTHTNNLKSNEDDEALPFCPSFRGGGAK